MMSKSLASDSNSMNHTGLKSEHVVTVVTLKPIAYSKSESSAIDREILISYLMHVHTENLYEGFACRTFMHDET